jgi:hypothetical protein
MLDSEIIYGGVKYNKVRHAILCKICKETIEAPDYKVCKCGSVAIDTGRLIGSLENMEDRSVYCAKVAGKTIWLPLLVSLAERVYTCAKL